jgi:membrane protein implicated in regulation of membrane protease activity
LWAKVATTNQPMNDQLLTIILMSLGVGIGLAILLLILVKLRRLNQQVNSLVDHNSLIGLIGVVQIPFDKNSKGKVRVNVGDSLIDVVAITEGEEQFNVGDKVFILHFQDNKVLVISEKYIRSDL